MIKLTLTCWRSNPLLTLLSWNDFNSATFKGFFSEELAILFRNLVLNGFRNTSQTKEINPLGWIRTVLASIDTPIKFNRVL